MDQLVVLLAPLATLVSVTGTVAVAPDGPGIQAVSPPGDAFFPPPEPPAAMIEDGRIAVSIAEAFRPQTQNQVRIEQRITIRISPRAGPPPRPFAMDLPDRAPPRLSERHIGKCVPIGGIAGVQIGQGNRLTLFLRDRRMVSLGLEIEEASRRVSTQRASASMPSKMRSPAPSTVRIETVQCLPIASSAKMYVSIQTSRRAASTAAVSAGKNSPPLRNSSIALPGVKRIIGMGRVR